MEDIKGWGWSEELGLVKTGKRPGGWKRTVKESDKLMA